MTFALLLLLAFSARPERGRYEQSYAKAVKYIEVQDWARAEANLKQALAYRDTNEARKLIRTARFHLNLDEATRLRGRHDYEAAAQRFQSALDLNPENTAAREGLRNARYDASFDAGVAARAANQLEQARTRFDECLSIKPGDASARKELDLIEGLSQKRSQLQTATVAAAERFQAHDWAGFERQLKTNPGVRSAFLNQDLSDFERWRRRRSWARYAVGPLILFYGLALCASIYVGIRRA